MIIYKSRNIVMLSKRDGIPTEVDQHFRHLLKIGILCCFMWQWENVPRYVIVCEL